MVPRDQPLPPSTSGSGRTRCCRREASSCRRRELTAAPVAGSGVPHGSPPDRIVHRRGRTRSRGDRDDRRRRPALVADPHPPRRSGYAGSGGGRRSRRRGHDPRSERRRFWAALLAGFASGRAVLPVGSESTVEERERSSRRTRSVRSSTRRRRRSSPPDGWSRSGSSTAASASAISGRATACSPLLDPRARRVTRGRPTVGRALDRVATVLVDRLAIDASDLVHVALPMQHAYGMEHGCRADRRGPPSAMDPGSRSHAGRGGARAGHDRAADGARDPGRSRAVLERRIVAPPGVHRGLAPAAVDRGSVRGGVERDARRSLREDRGRDDRVRIRTAPDAGRRGRGAGLRGRRTAGVERRDVRWVRRRRRRSSRSGTTDRRLPPHRRSRGPRPGGGFGSRAGPRCSSTSAD